MPRVLTIVLTIGSAIAAFAASALRLADPLPVDRPDSYLAVSGGHLGRTTSARTAAGVACYSFPKVTAGFTDAAAGYVEIGTAIAPPANLEIDWEAMASSFAATEAAKCGYVFYVASTNADTRIIAARAGEFSITWYLKNGHETTIDYATRLPASPVAHRLYWTSAPLNGPGVAVPSNFSVQLCGDTNLFSTATDLEISQNSANVCGVHYDAENHIIQAFARENADGSYEGPIGAFVVAYYDNGDCTRYLGCTVVQVTGPDVVYLSAKVGDEVRPQNENYNPTSGVYQAELASNSNGSDDPRAPYFFIQDKVDGQYHKKENRVFAVSETVPSEAGAKRAEIWWKASDDFGTFWPIEETCYNLTWPDSPTVVLGAAGLDGTPGVTVPDGYSPSLLDWQNPKDCASMNGETLTLHKAGRFTLKLTTDANDDFTLVPLKVALSDDPTAFAAGTTRVWSIGREITSDDWPDFQGYLYAPSSPGCNWNEGIASNALYFVNTASGDYDMEVWWRRAYRPSGLDGDLVFPCEVERFKAAWPAGREVQDIVFASEKGSGAGGFAATDRALRLMSSSAKGALAGSLIGELGEATVCFWLNAGPHAGGRDSPEATTGAVCRVTLGDDTVSIAIERAATATEAAVGRVTLGSGESAMFTAEPDIWTPWFIISSTNGCTVHCDTAPILTHVDHREADPERDAFYFEVGGTSAAAGVSIDTVRAWNIAFTADELKSWNTNGLAIPLSCVAVTVDFEETSRAGNAIYARDDVSLKYFSGSDLKTVTPGGPAWNDGYLQATNGVIPSVYAVSAKNSIGYNPNEEHALVLAENGGYSVYALRSDMNDDANPPYALVQYEKDGRPSMSVYRVHTTNEWYAWPTISVTAGNKVILPHPLDAMPSGKSLKTTAIAKTNAADAAVLFRDRSGQDWARRDGVADLSICYIGEPGFVCTGGETSSRDLTGADIPLINLANAYVWGEVGVGNGSGSKGVERETLFNSTSTPVTLYSEWPDPLSVPQMSVAQVAAQADGGLPNVYDMKTCAVAYPFRAADPVVKLIDPTVRREAPISVTSDFTSEYGFTLGKTGNCFLRDNCYYFADMPATVADRLFVDVSISQPALVLVGDYVESAAETSYLRANTLSQTDAAAICAKFKDIQEGQSETTVKARLDELMAAVNAIAAMDDVVPTLQVETPALPDDDIHYVTNAYTAADHYALVATGAGSGFVTLVENDGEAAASLPVSLHVLYVGTNLYSGRIVTLTDANNVLSEQVSAMYTAPLGKSADNFTFDWYYADSPTDGHVPTVPAVSSSDPGVSYSGGDSAWEKEAAKQSGQGASAINTVQGANSGSVSMKDLVNRYWTMHYRANEGTMAAKVTGGSWSTWCQPALVEGWLQRVLNAVNPFTQRMTDLMNNEAETLLTMPEQIGAPWTGDVAINNDILADVGLEEFYRTILNRAEKMSIAQGASTTDESTNDSVNKQLLEATARLADMRMTLGAEAYSDAQNPLIASTDGTEYSGAVFCFANQVPTLLDEELALLRGRTKSVAPAMNEFPFYNRLMWNFTKGVTQGEVAYANNYNILGEDGQIDAEAAAKMYPQGHGDAYGYYLSTLKDYYRLLRNPHFSWGKPAMIAMAVADHTVNVNYQEEDKFAEAAYDLAKIGAEVVSLTARKQWKDNPADPRSAYFDNTNTVLSTSISSLHLSQAFGYGEWGARAGYGAFVNWAVANTILPNEDQATNYFADASIATITRATSSSLTPLGSSVATIESALNGVDADLNPLGLSNDAIPFDISPGEYEGTYTRQEAKCHYEQIRDRVGTALANAKTVLDYANVYGSRLREIENEQFETEAEAAEMEQAYETQLIEIYGRPYADDIGAGKTYAEGYSGPDLYHYMYAELDDYGLESVDSYTNNLQIEVVSGDSYTSDWYKNVDLSGGTVTNGMTLVMRIDSTVSYTLTPDGFIAKPQDFVGMRASEGLLQSSYRDFLSAYVSAKSADASYQTALSDYEVTMSQVQLKLEENSSNYTALAANNETKRAYTYSLMGLSLTKVAVSLVAQLAAKTAFGNVKAMGKDEMWDSDFNTICFFYDEDENSVENTVDNYLDAYASGRGALAQAAQLWTVRKQLTSILNNAEKARKEYTGTYSLNGGNGQGDREAVENLMKTANLTTKEGVRSVVDEINEQFKITNGHGDTLNTVDAAGVTSATYDAGRQKYEAIIVKSYNKIGFTTHQSSTVTTAGDDKKTVTYLCNADGKLSDLGTYAAQKLDQEADDKAGGQEDNDQNAQENQDPEMAPVVGADANTIPTKTLLKKSYQSAKTVIYYAEKVIALAANATSLVLQSVLNDTNIQLQELQNDYQWYSDSKKLYDSLVSKGESLVKAAQNVTAAHAALLEAAQTYLAVVDEGEALQEMREKDRARLAATSTAARYRDMYARTARNVALSKYRSAFDAAQRQVFQLAKAYDYETGMGTIGTSAGKGTFADAAIATRSLGTQSVVSDGSSITDPGLWDVVSRMDANFAQLKTRLGINNPDESEKWFSLRTGLLNLSSGSEGDESWRMQLASWWRDDVFADADVARLCQKPADSVAAEPGFVIPFESAIYSDCNFFNRIQGRNNAGSVYSSSDCSVKIYSAGVDFVNYDNLVQAYALVAEPNVYLVPAGTDYMRAPSNNVRVVRSFNVVDQVLPIPYAVSEDEVKADDWSVSSGLGSSLSNYGTRRFSTMRACAGLSSSRLIGRSVWNDRWLLVIPARYLHSNVETARRNFLYGAKGLGGVKDIKIGIKAYSRSGN